MGGLARVDRWEREPLEGTDQEPGAAQEPLQALAARGEGELSAAPLRLVGNRSVLWVRGGRSPEGGVRRAERAVVSVKPGSVSGTTGAAGSRGARPLPCWRRLPPPPPFPKAPRGQTPGESFRRQAAPLNATGRDSNAGGRAATGDAHRTNVAFAPGFAVF